MASELKDNFDRITVRFRPKNAFIAFVLRVDRAVLNSHVLCKLFLLNSSLFLQCQELFLSAKIHG